MRSGIDHSASDPAVRPQDDLFGHVNGAWVARTEIPADRGRYGSSAMLRETPRESRHIPQSPGDRRPNVAAGRHL